MFPRSTSDEESCSKESCMKVDKVNFAVNWAWILKQWSRQCNCDRPNCLWKMEWQSFAIQTIIFIGVIWTVFWLIKVRPLICWFGFRKKTYHLLCNLGSPRLGQGGGEGGEVARWGEEKPVEPSLGKHFSAINALQWGWIGVVVKRRTALNSS